MSKGFWTTLKEANPKRYQLYRKAENARRRKWYKKRKNDIKFMKEKRRRGREWAKKNRAINPEKENKKVYEWRKKHPNKFRYIQAVSIFKKLPKPMKTKFIEEIKGY